MSALKYHAYKYFATILEGGGNVEEIINNIQEKDLREYILYDKPFDISLLPKYMIKLIYYSVPTEDLINTWLVSLSKHQAQRYFIFNKGELFTCIKKQHVSPKYIILHNLNDYNENMLRRLNNSTTVSFIKQDHFLFNLSGEKETQQRLFYQELCRVLKYDNTDIETTPFTFFDFRDYDIHKIIKHGDLTFLKNIINLDSLIEDPVEIQDYKLSAIKYNQLEIFKYLDKKQYPFYTDLHYCENACWYGHIDIARYLEDKLLLNNVQKKIILMNSIFSNNLELIKYFINKFKIVKFEYILSDVLGNSNSKKLRVDTLSYLISLNDDFSDSFKSHIFYSKNIEMFNVLLPVTLKSIKNMCRDDITCFLSVNRDIDISFVDYLFENIQYNYDEHIKCLDTEIITIIEKGNLKLLEHYIKKFNIQINNKYIKVAESYRHLDIKNYLSSL